jgi:hypothetical protein
MNATLQHAMAIEDAVLRATQVKISLVQPAYKMVDIEVLGDVVRCREYRGEVVVTGPTLVHFSMPTPQWFTDALAGGAYESNATRQAWENDSRARALDIAAERDPEGLDADAAR